MISLLISYLGISLLVTPFIRKATRERINLESEINKVMSESIRTIVDVHLSNSEKFFQERFNKAGRVAYPFLWKAETFPELPRALIEPLGLTFICSIGLFPLVSKNRTSNLLEIVAILATIQSGYIPDWLDKLVSPKLFKELDEHCKVLMGAYPDVSDTTFWHGWFHPEDEG